MNTWRHELVVRCEHGHETHVQCRQLPGKDPGTVTYLAGSSADFCDTCDGIIVDILEVRERPPENPPVTTPQTRKSVWPACTCMIVHNERNTTCPRNH